MVRISPGPRGQAIHPDLGIHMSFVLDKGLGLGCIIQSNNLNHMQDMSMHCCCNQYDKHIAKACNVYDPYICNMCIVPSVMHHYMHSDGVLLLFSCRLLMYCVIAWHLHVHIFTPLAFQGLNLWARRAFVDTPLQNSQWSRQHLDGHWENKSDTMRVIPWLHIVRPWRTRTCPWSPM